MNVNPDLHLLFNFCQLQKLNSVISQMQTVEKTKIYINSKKEERKERKLKGLTKEEERKYSKR